MKPSRSFSPARFFSGVSAAGLALLPAIAAAHPGHYHPPGEDDEFDAIAAGLAHPLTGLDHLLLAIAAGWLALSWKDGKARVPAAAFIASLALGALAGRGVQAGAVLEVAISATLLAAGAAFVSSSRLKVGVLAALLPLAGFIHGFAHGAEAPATASFAAYSAGFIASTAALLGLGILLRALTRNAAAPLMPRLAGCALLAFGSFSLIQAL